MENKNYLLITLGHGSSAIFVDKSDPNFETPTVIGYEEERLSRIKADSQFPVDAINEIMRNVPFERLKNCAIRVSHWFNFTAHVDYEHGCPTCKYFTEHDFDMLKRISNDIKFVNPNFTHHDAHAWSAYEFVCDKLTDRQLQKIAAKPMYCIVADGFGNDKEVFSVYVKQEGDPRLIHRAYGYNNSLGLFYQYATSYVGMKENQDEYKFLGYESHIFEEFDAEAIEKINGYISSIAGTLTQGILRDQEKPNCTEDIDIMDMRKTKDFWYAAFNLVMDDLGFDINDQTREDVSSWRARVAIARLIQGVVETVLEHVIEHFGIDNVCLAGGCFYNVKLNNRILTYTHGLFSVIPLAGDQGAAIGMYAKEHEDSIFPFGTLCWGRRRLYNIEKLTEKNDRIIVYDMEQVDSHTPIIDAIVRHLANNHIVNIIYGGMEFGPRALCHTTTLMLPSSENTAKNNRMNHRNEVMPCAPVVTEGNARKLFCGEELSRVIGSDDYMICTHEYKRTASEYYAGVMHSVPGTPYYSGRPQVVHPGTFMWDLLNRVEELTDMKCLVNTSFNVHGNPIVFDTMDIISNFNFQCEHAGSYEDQPYLFIIK